MNEDEYVDWEDDAFNCLSYKYEKKEVYTVLRWFRSIKASKEAALIGSERLEAYRIFHGDPDANPHYNLYDSMMIRVWAYAPAILKEHNESK